MNNREELKRINEERKIQRALAENSETIVDKLIDESNSNVLADSLNNSLIDQHKKDIILPDNYDDSEYRTIRKNFYLSKTALENITKYQKKYRYRSLNGFVNDLFTSLDKYLSDSN